MTTLIVFSESLATEAKQFKIVDMQYTENSTIAVTMIEEAEEIYDWQPGYASDSDETLVAGIPGDNPNSDIESYVKALDSQLITKIRQISQLRQQLAGFYQNLKKEDALQTFYQQQIEVDKNFDQDEMMLADELDAEMSTVNAVNTQQFTFNKRQ